MTHTAATEKGTKEPFGVRYLVSPAKPGTEKPVMTYSEKLQINVNASGNPWHALSPEVGETHTETSGGDGSGPGSDSGTDLY
jgi:hypothetical protein